MLLRRTSAPVAKRSALLLLLNLPVLELVLPLAQPIPAILTLDNALAGVLDNGVEPRREPEPRLGDLLGNDGDGGLVVGAADLLVADSFGPVGHDGGADECVCVGGPEHGRVDWFSGLEALGPRA